MPVSIAHSFAVRSSSSLFYDWRNASIAMFSTAAVEETTATTTTSVASIFCCATCHASCWTTKNTVKTTRHCSLLLFVIHTRSPALARVHPHIQHTIARVPPSLHRTRSGDLASFSRLAKADSVAFRADTHTNTHIRCIALLSECLFV